MAESTFTITNTAATSPDTAYSHQVVGIANAHKAAAFLSRHMLGVFAISNERTVFAFYVNGVLSQAKATRRRAA